MALGYMRRHKRWLYVFLWVVIAGFIVYFIPFFQGEEEGAPGQTLATVGSLKISVAEYQRASIAQRQRFEAMMQGQQRNVDRAMIRQMASQQALRKLVQDRILRLEFERLGLRVDDQTLVRQMQEDPQFQRDGQFVGVDALRDYARRTGQTLEDIEEDYRQGMLLETLKSLLTAGIDVTEAEAEQEFRRRNEKLRVEYAIVEAARYKAEATVTDEEVRARFEANKEKYRVPERRVLAYLLVDRQALAARTPVTDGEIERYFADNDNDFRQPGQVCAHHILVRVKSKPADPGHSDEEARKLAEGLLQQLQGGTKFEDLAKKSSEDTFTARTGGDLGCFGPGMQPAGFDEAADAIEDGKFSDTPVRTQYGYHIIRVNSRTPDSVPELAIVKEQVRGTVHNQKTASAMEAAVNSIANALRRGNTLENAAKAESLTVQKSAPFARGQVIEPIPPDAVTRAFEMKPGEVDAEGHAAARGHLFVHLLEVQPARIPELKDAQEQVKADLVQEKALEKARAKAVELKAQAEKAGLTGAATAAGTTRKETPALVGHDQPWADLGSSLLLEEAVFALPEKALSDPLRVAGGYAVVRVLEKKPFDAAAFDREKASLISSLREAKRQKFLEAYLGLARQRFPLELRTEVLKRLTG